MQGQKIYRVILVIVLLVAVSMACNLFSNLETAKEAVEMVNTVEALTTNIDIEGISTDMGAMITDIDIEGMTTDVGAMITEIDIEGITTDVGGFITEMPDFSGEKPADIPIMPGNEELIGSTDFIEYMANEGAAQVASYYEREMPVNGWVKVDGSSEEDYVTLVFEKGGRKATIELFEFFGQTSVTITIEGG